MGTSKVSALLVFLNSQNPEMRKPAVVSTSLIDSRAFRGRRSFMFHFVHSVARRGTASGS